MIAAWYDQQGPAAEVLRVGELPAAEPGPGEVRVRLTVSGANPGDMKKRQAWLGSPMAFPRIVPHSDGAGVIEAAGPGPGGPGGVGVRSPVLPALRDRRAGRRAGRGGGVLGDAVRRGRDRLREAESQPVRDQMVLKAERGGFFAIGSGGAPG